MIHRLPGFALYLAMAPAQVWALTTEEFAVLAPTVDAVREEREQAARELARVRR